MNMNMNRLQRTTTRNKRKKNHSTSPNFRFCTRTTASLNLSLTTTCFDAPCSSAERRFNSNARSPIHSLKWALPMPSVEALAFDLGLSAFEVSLALEGAFEAILGRAPRPAASCSAVPSIDSACSVEVWTYWAAMSERTSGRRWLSIAVVQRLRALRRRVLRRCNDLISE